MRGELANRDEPGGSRSPARAEGDGAASFEQFVRTSGPRLQRALVAAYGAEIGVDAYADAIGVAWERWATIGAMVNPVGYLYRVGQSRARPGVRWQNRRQAFAGEYAGAADATTPADLLDAAGALSVLRREQRVAVLMVKAWGFTYPETAAVLGISEAAVGNHIRRGLAILRHRLKEQR